MSKLEIFENSEFGEIRTVEVTMSLGLLGEM